MVAAGTSSASMSDDVMGLGNTSPRSVVCSGVVAAARERAVAAAGTTAVVVSNRDKSDTDDDDDDRAIGQPISLDEERLCKVSNVVGTGVGVAETVRRVAATPMPPPFTLRSSTPKAATQDNDTLNTVNVESQENLPTDGIPWKSSSATPCPEESQDTGLGCGIGEADAFRLLSCSDDYETALSIESQLHCGAVSDELHEAYTQGTIVPYLCRLVVPQIEGFSTSHDQNGGDRFQGSRAWDGYRPLDPYPADLPKPRRRPRHMMGRFSQQQMEPPFSTRIQIEHGDGIELLVDRVVCVCLCSSESSIVFVPALSMAFGCLSCGVGPSRSLPSPFVPSCLLSYLSCTRLVERLMKEEHENAIELCMVMIAIGFLLLVLTSGLRLLVSHFHVYDISNLSPGRAIFRIVVFLVQIWFSWSDSPCPDRH